MRLIKVEMFAGSPLGDGVVLIVPFDSLATCTAFATNEKSVLPVDLSFVDRGSSRPCRHHAIRATLRVR